MLLTFTFRTSGAADVAQLIVSACHACLVPNCCKHKDLRLWSPFLYLWNLDLRWFSCRQRRKQQRPQTRTKMARRKRSTGNVKRLAVRQCTLCALQVLLKGLCEGLPWPVRVPVSACLWERHAPRYSPQTNAGTVTCWFWLLRQSPHTAASSTLWLYLAQWEKSHPDQLCQCPQMHLAVAVPALGLEGQGIGHDRFKVPVGTHVCLHFVMFLFTSCSTPTFFHFLMQVSKTAELGRGSSVVVHIHA